MDNFIQIYPNVISKEICEYFINHFKEQDKIGKTYQGHAGGTLKKDVKDCQDLIFYYKEYEKVKNVVDYFDIVYDKFTEYLKYYNSPINGFIYNRTDLGGWKDTLFHPPYMALMHRYEPPTQGYHRWHQDWQSTERNFASRMLVGMLYLNDVYIGGETEFYHQNLKIKPEQGTLVIWPAYFTHVHKGNKPISNTKYIMNTWAYPVL